MLTCLKFKQVATNLAI